MLLAVLAVVFGLILLVWSADRFVDGAAATAKHAGMPPLLIGMLVVGFGTSAPEMVVSAFAAAQGNPALALGNAYGSNVANIGLILGLTALIAPIAVHSSVVRKEMPILLIVTLLAGWQLRDGEISYIDAVILVLGLAVLMGISAWLALRNRSDHLGSEMSEELEGNILPLSGALLWLIAGLILLMLSSKLLVWGAVDIAKILGVSDLVIGLTVVALGTSLPELAAALVAVRRNEHDLALGNVLGSNLFNTLAVVGIAGLIMPIQVPPEVINRDWPVMFAMTLGLFVMAYGFLKPGHLTRWEAGLLLGGFIAYNAWLWSGIAG